MKPQFAAALKPILSPNAPTLATLFSCGGLYDVGAIAAGVRPILAVEYDPSNPKLSEAFADSYEQNIGAHVLRQSVQQVDWRKYDAPDILHASPVCKQFSTAKSNGKESAIDIECAEAVCQALRIWQPKAFTLENVRAYAKSKSWAMILQTLYELGYWVSSGVLNAADFGVPQTRMRFMCWATRGQIAPSLPPATKWMSWHEAIADLLPNLPESQLAPWQRDRLPQLVKDTLLDGKNASVERRPTLVGNDGEAPATLRGSFAIAASVDKGMPKAFLIERCGARSDRDLNTREAHQPAWTVRASVGTDQNGANRNEAINAFLHNIPDGKAAQEFVRWWERGRVVRLDARAIARLQSVPDWYVLPEQIKHAGPLIGNGVPCLMAQGIVDAIAANLYKTSTRAGDRIYNLANSQQSSI